MRLEDVIESLSTCCCNVDDELRISNIAEDVVQVSIMNSMYYIANDYSYTCMVMMLLIIILGAI